MRSNLTVSPTSRTTMSINGQVQDTMTVDKDSGNDAVEVIDNIVVGVQIAANLHDPHSIENR